jgi:hypothetical protein
VRTGQILVESGQTPSGFGLALHKSAGSWRFRPLSPCCGHFIDFGGDDQLRCTNCATSWQTYADECRGTVGNDVPINQDGPLTNEVVARWVARIMQYPNPEGTHGVEVSIKWT